MSTANLNKRTIDGLACPAGREEEIYWDAQLSGFGLRVTDKGRKTYLIQYRTESGRSRRLTLGQHGHLCPHEARKMAQAELARVAKGDDPTEERKRLWKGETVRDLWELYMERHATIHKKPTSVESDRYLSQSIIEALGARKISDVTRLDIEGLHHKHKAQPIKANRMLALVSKMFNLAESWELRAPYTNPARGVRKYPERARERYLEDAEFARLLQILDERELAQIETPHVIAAYKLLLFTGCRLGEIRSLKWEYVDFERRCLKLPDSKTGAKTVILNDLAIGILQDIPRVLGNPYVIASSVTSGAVINLQKPWRRIRAAAGLDDVRIHDLRHTFASIAVMDGLSLVEVGRLLGHTKTQTTLRYAHLSTEAQLKSSNRVADKMAAIMKEVQQSNVVPFRRM